jgi:hypothetical protein
MAICRFGDDCDVYVHYSSTGGLDCCGCALSGKGTFNASDEAAMLSHLRDHVTAGHKVPPQTLDRLKSPDDL